jgi:hypothetical protein
MLPRYLGVTAAQIQDVAAATFRADNRVILTYLPELPPADTASLESETGEAPEQMARDGSAEDDEVAA